MLDEQQTMWIFAYGSLVFRPSFSWIERRRAFVTGWTRRFWQGSPDHRGVPEAPGRVVTLVEAKGEACGGCAYRVDPRDAEQVLGELDHREQAGFERRVVPLLDEAPPGGRAFAEGIVYVARETNPHFLGALPEAEIATLVRVRRGPSGSNADYVERLRDGLRALDAVDDHVERIAAALAAPGPSSREP